MLLQTSLCISLGLRVREFSLGCVRGIGILEVQGMCGDAASFPKALCQFILAPAVDEGSHCSTHTQLHSVLSELRISVTFW